MRHSVAAPTRPRALGVNFLGFARQGSNVGCATSVTGAGRTAVTEARLTRISWPLMATAVKGHQLLLLHAMRSNSSASRRQHWPAAKIALACLCACFSWSTVVRADPSDLPPEVGYNYDEIETARITGKNGADRALGSSVSALFNNPANMAASRVYHASAFAQIWPEAKRQSYGVAAVDSVSSSTRVSGGLGATWNRQDPNGVDRTATDLRFALAYPF